jgi:hypothetical protein
MQHAIAHRSKSRVYHAASNHKCKQCPSANFMYLAPAADDTQIERDYISFARVDAAQSSAIRTVAVASPCRRK